MGEVDPLEAFLQKVEALEKKGGEGGEVREGNVLEGVVEGREKREVEGEVVVREGRWVGLERNVKLMRSIEKAGLEKPSEIQALSIPVALRGGDVIGIAETGSGKTFAFLFPMILHIVDKPKLRGGSGPIGLVLCPTRELAHQTFLQFKKFFRPQGCNVCPVYGSLGNWEQKKALHQPCEAIVATPGRLLDMIKSKATKLENVSFVVLDEADKMLTLGFEGQVKRILEQCMTERQTLLFSATFKKNDRLHRLVQEFMRNPVKIQVGKVGRANVAVDHVPILFQPGTESFLSKRLSWTENRLSQLLLQSESTENPKVLIFVGEQGMCSKVSAYLLARHPIWRIAILHGGMHQVDRHNTMVKFRIGEFQVLIATDVAARGIHVDDISHVICFDPSRDKDAQVHRMGRTGRMGGIQGTCYSLVHHDNSKYASVLVQTLAECSQEPPSELLALAMKNPYFHYEAPSSSSSSPETKVEELKYGMFTKGNILDGMLERKRPSLNGDDSVEITQKPTLRLSREERNALSFTVQQSSNSQSETFPTPPRKRKSRWD